MRATREITITVEGVDHKVGIYTFINGFEKQEMTRIMTAGSTISGSNPEINGDAVMKGQDYLIRTLIASLDGSTEDVYNKLMTLHSDAYDLISAEINKMMTDWGKKKEA
jgi:hypothetical protein